MENDWIKFYTVGNIQEAEMIKGMLHEKGIEINIMNQKDSLYQFGDIYLYVQKKDEPTAKKLLDEQNQSE